MQTVWHRDDIASILASLDDATESVALRVPTEGMKLYRMGYINAIDNVRRAFGIRMKSADRSLDVLETG